MVSTMVITNVYKLFKDGNHFKKESKKLMRSEIALPRAFVEEKNAKWEQNGLWHEIDEDATKKYYIWGEKKVAKRIAEAEAQEKLKNVLTDVLVQGSKVIEPKKVEKIESTDDNSNEVNLKELQEEYKKVTGKKLVGKYAKDIPWMQKKIYEFKQNNK